MVDNDPLKVASFQSITVGSHAGAVDDFQRALQREMATQAGVPPTVAPPQYFDTASPLGGLRTYATAMMESEMQAKAMLREMPQRIQAILKGTHDAAPKELTYINGQMSVTDRHGVDGTSRSQPVDDPNESDDAAPTDINALMIKSMKEIQERTILMNREERRMIETMTQMNITQNLGFGILRGAYNLLTSFLRPS